MAPKIKDATSTTLKFGDEILLACSDAGGFLQGEAIITKHCYIDRVKAEYDPSKTVHNIQHCVFKVTPRYQYSAFKACEKHLRFSGLTNVDLENWKVKLDPEDGEHAALIESFEALEDEAAINELDCARQSGLDVLYGSVIQLKHSKSSLFLTQVRNRAYLNKLAMEICLNPGKKGSWWRIKSADGIKVDGEQVILGDRVFFESVRFYDSSVSIFTEEALQTKDHGSSTLHPSCECRLEVNATAYPSNFQLRPYRTFQTMSTEDEEEVENEETTTQVSGLDVVCFYRRRDGAYLGVNGTTNRVEWCYRKKGGDGNSDFTIPSSLWRIQPKVTDFCGKEISVSGQLVLVQHVLTGQYLTCEKKFVSLTVKYASPKALWTIRPWHRVTGDDELADGDVVWLQNVHENHEMISWLSLQKKSVMKGKGGEPNAVCTQQGEVPGDEDVLEVKAITRDKSEIVEKVMLCNAIFKTCLLALQRAARELNERQFQLQMRQQRQQEEAEQEGGAVVQEEEVILRSASLDSIMEDFRKELEIAVSTIMSLCKFEQEELTTSEKATQENQDIIREIGILSIAMSIIDESLLNFDVALASVASEHPCTHAVMRQLYAMIDSVCNRNQRNKSVMLTFVPQMSRHLPANVGSFTALVQVYSNSRELLENLEDEVFEEQVKLLKKVRNSVTVNLIMETCSCAGVPIPRNQNRWAQLIFVEAPELVFQTEMTGNDIHLTSSEGSVSLRMLMRKGESNIFATGNAEWSSGSSRGAQQFCYHLRVLKLMETLVEGRNESVLKIFLSSAERLGVEPRQLLLIVNNSSMPFSYRAACCSVFVALYVDQNPHHYIPRITTTRVWSSSKPPDFEHFLRGGDKDGVLPKSILDDFKSCLAEELSASATSGKSSDHEEYFLVSILKAISKLLELGFYHDREEQLKCGEIKPIASALLSVIKAGDGRGREGDVFVRVDSDSRSSRTRETHEQQESTIGTPMTMGERLKDVSFGFTSKRAEKQQMRFSKAWTRKMLCVLALLQDIVEHEINIKVIRFVDFWERCLTHCLGCNSWEQLMQEIAAKPPSAPSTRSGKEANGDVMSFSQRKGESLSDSLGIGRYMMDEGLWGREPPWAEAEVVEFFQEISEEEIILQDFSFSKLDWMTCRSRTDVVHALFNLMRVKAPAIKERAFMILKSMYSQSSSFFLQLSSVHLICDPQVAVRYFNIKREYARLNEVSNSLHEFSSLASRSTQDDERRVCDEFISILKRWNAPLKNSCLLAYSVDLEYDCKRILSSIEADALLLEFLELPLAKTTRSAGAQLDRLKDDSLREVVLLSLELLGNLCRNDAGLQERMMKRAGLIWSYMAVENVPAGELLASMLGNNYRLMMERSKQWIERMFSDYIVRYKTILPDWMLLLRSISSCQGVPWKENQHLINRLLQSQDFPVLHVLQEFDPCPHSDQSILSVSALQLSHSSVLNSTLPYEEDEEETMYLESLELITSLCEGKNPSPQIHACSLMTVEQLVVRIAARDLDNTFSNKARIIKASRSKVAHLRFLTWVYLKTDVEKLWQELHSDSSGLFVQLPSARASLIDSVVQDLRSSISLLGIFSASDLDDQESMFQVLHYLSRGLLPFLEMYFAVPKSVATHRVKKENLPAVKEMCVHVQQIHILARSAFRDRNRYVYIYKVLEPAVRSCLHSMQTADGLFWGNFEEFTNEREEMRARMSKILAHHALRKSFQSLIADFKSNMGVIAQEGNLSLMVSFDDAEEGEGGHRTRLPIGRDILSICKNRAADEHTLFEVLRTMRLSLYLYEPAGAEEVSLANLEDHLDDFRKDRPLSRIYGPEKKVIKWMQNKFDAMGCTVAALKLFSHKSKRIQTEAVRLLMVLLQGKNLRVQNTVSTFLTKNKSNLFFSRVLKILDSTIRSMEYLKRNSVSNKVKRMKIVDQLEATGAHTPHETDIIESEYGKSSLAVLVLRLLQLMCEGQCKAIQDLISSQPGMFKSYDILKRCFDLFEVVQPLLPAALSSNDSHGLIILCLQLVETITEAVQGPNTKNLAVLLSSNFLTSVNRVLAFCSYTSSEGMGLGGWASAAPGLFLSINDLRCCLKITLLRCILSFFEVVTDLQVPRQIRNFFDLKMFAEQIVENGKLLGFVDYHRRHIKSMRLQQKRNKTNLGLSDKGFSLEGIESLLEEETYYLYFIMLYLQDFDDTGDVRKHVHGLKEEYPRLYKFLKEHTSHVELVRRIESTGKSWVEKVYFSLDDSIVSMAHNSDYKDRMTELIRSTPNNETHEKYVGFIQQLKSMLNQLVWYEAVARYRTVRVLIRRRKWVKKSTLSLSILITALLLIFYGIPMDPNTGGVFAQGRFFSKGTPPAGYQNLPYPYANDTSDPKGLGSTYGLAMSTIDYSLKYRLRLESRWASEKEWLFWPEGKSLVYFLTVVHLLLTVLYSLSYFILDFPLDWLHLVDEYKKEIKAKLKEKSASAEDEDANLKKGKEYLLHLPPVPNVVLEEKIGMTLVLRTLSKCLNLWYFIGLTTFSVLGVISSPFFQVFCMLDYFRQPGGRMVTRAIYVGGPALLRSFAVGVMVISVYGFLGYAYYSQSAIISDESCHSPFQCVTKFIVDSFGGDIRTVLGNFSAWAFPALDLWSDIWYSGRTLFIVTFVIFWSFLLQPVVTGQIINAFNEMRQAKDDIRKYLESKCFISGIDRFKFDDYPGEWEKREAGKYAWNYLFFLRWLSLHDPQDYNMIQSMVAKGFEKEKPDFFPNGLFVGIQRDELEEQNDESKDQVRNAMRDLRDELSDQREMMAKASSRLSKIEDRIEEVAEKLFGAPSTPGAQVQTTPTQQPSTFVL